MTTAVRHTHAIQAIERLIQETIPDGLGMLGDGCGTTIAAIQKSFKGFIRLADSRFDALLADISKWRQNVCRGETEFSQTDESEFKEALRALIALADLLHQRAETYHRQNIVLHRPSIIGMLHERMREAQKMLDSWQSPEWEVIGMRTVKWDKEQTRHLRARLASRK